MIYLLITTMPGYEKEAKYEILDILLGRTASKIEVLSISKGTLLIKVVDEGEQELAKILGYLKDTPTRYIIKVIPFMKILEGRKLSEIISETIKLCSKHLKPHTSFRVRCKIRGRKDLSKTQLEREIGRIILEKFKDRDIKVQLKNPDIQVRIETLNDYVLIGIVRREHIVRKKSKWNTFG